MRKFSQKEKEYGFVELFTYGMRKNTVLDDFIVGKVSPIVSAYADSGTLKMISTKKNESKKPIFGEDFSNKKLNFNYFDIDI